MLESLKRKQGRKVFDPMPLICPCGKQVPEKLRIYKRCPDCYNEASDRIESRLDHSRYQKMQNQDQEAAEYEKQR